MKREPVIVAQLVAAVMAILSLLVALGVIDLGDAELTQIEQATAAVLTVMIPLIAALWARFQVTPVAAPKDDTGTPLQRVDGLPPVKD